MVTSTNDAVVGSFGSFGSIVTYEGECGVLVVITDYRGVLDDTFWHRLVKSVRLDG